MVVKLANGAKVQARIRYSQTAVWVWANGEFCTVESIICSFE